VYYYFLYTRERRAITSITEMARDTEVERGDPEKQMARNREVEIGDPEELMARNTEVERGDPEQQMATQQRANTWWYPKYSGLTL
jgi:hypothetical protein